MKLLSAILVRSGVDFSIYLALTEAIQSELFWERILIALGVVLINSILMPILTTLFNVVKCKITNSKLTKEQKDELINVVESIEDKIEEEKDKLNKKEN